jgi:hypothetical protein
MFVQMVQFHEELWQGTTIFNIFCLFSGQVKYRFTCPDFCKFFTWLPWQPEPLVAMATKVKNLKSLFL